MIRSGMETTLRAVLYSGCCSKRVEFSRVEASSGDVVRIKCSIFCIYDVLRENGSLYLCMLARTLAQMGGST